MKFEKYFKKAILKNICERLIIVIFVLSNGNGKFETAVIKDFTVEKTR